MSKIWRYGDHVDTDVIIPARYLNISDFNELAEHAMEDIDTTFAPNVKKDEIMVAGKNFGCGSSREHAPVVIKVKGIKCIIADTSGFRKRLQSDAGQMRAAPSAERDAELSE